MAKISALLLAAGLSMRMKGRHKLLLPYKGRPLLHHVMDTLSSCEVDEWIVVTNERIHDYLESDEGTGAWKIVLNQDYHHGMMTSLHHGIRALDPQCEGILICLADMPLITVEEYDLIIDRFEERLKEQHDGITVPYYEGRQGHPVLFSTHYTKELLEYDGPEGPKDLLQKYAEKVIPVEMRAAHIVHDIDTPEQYDDLLNDT